MSTYVLLGGGEIKEDETYTIDKHIVDITGKINPEYLFIPTASNDSESYIETMMQLYGKKLGCSFNALQTCNTNVNSDTIDEMINHADIIYVGGGNTRYMIEQWGKNGIIDKLKKKSESSCVLCGISAGAICWFESGISDSNSYSENGEWEYSLVNGIGIVKGIICPHFDERRIDQKFIRFIDENNLDFYAIDDGCAIEIEKNDMRVINNKNGKSAYIINARNGKMDICLINNVKMHPRRPGSDAV